MNTHEIFAKTDDYVLKTYGRTPLAFERGEGVTLYDTDGRAFLDLNSGLGVNALGHCHPEVIRLINEASKRIVHTSNLYHIPSQALCAEKLCGKSFGVRAFFCNSGTEAVEGALKLARKWGKQFSVPKTEVVAFRNSFHGRTFGALSATMQEKYQKGFEPLVPGFVEAVFNDTASLEKAVGDATAAIIIEPVQGEGGVNVATPAFMERIGDICRERDILFIVDEVQCGMARTGKLFAHEHYDVTPDLMTLAKPLAGGLPIGAVVVGERVFGEVKPGEHASTFGGNHFVTSVACGVFDILSDPAFLADVKDKGAYLTSELGKLASKHEAIVEIRGKGLLIGVQVDFPAAEAVKFFMDNGVLICAAGAQVIRFIPPLILTKADIDRAVGLLDRFLTERTSG